MMRKEKKTQMTQSRNGRVAIITDSTNIKRITKQ